MYIYNSKRNVAHSNIVTMIELSFLIMIFVSSFKMINGIKIKHNLIQMQLH